MTKVVDAPAGKKAMPEYEENPSLPVASRSARIGQKRIPNKAGDKLMVVNDNGEVIAGAGFHEIIEVDQSQFVKFYVGGVKLFNDLGAPGVKVFELLYKVILKSPNIDKVFLHPKQVPRMSRATFDRGVVELLAKEIIYKSTLPGHYYINVNYLFNGDRLALVKEYRLKATVDGPRDFVQEELPL